MFLTRIMLVHYNGNQNLLLLYSFRVNFLGYHPNFWRLEYALRCVFIYWITINGWLGFVWAVFELKSTGRLCISRCHPGFSNLTVPVQLSHSFVRFNFFSLVSNHLISLLSCYGVSAVSQQQYTNKCMETGERA